MEYFSFPDKEVLTPQFFSQDMQAFSRKFISPESQEAGRAVEDRNLAVLGFSRGGQGAVTFAKEGFSEAIAPDLQDQFFVFQFSSSKEEKSILESTQVMPKIEGSEQEPDVLVNLELQSFNVGKEENIDNDTRATMRINIGKDENSRDKYFDTVFWSIAAGLDLYNRAQNKPTEGKDFKSDFRKAFANRPIEIPGGLCKLAFEVVKHQEPPWYKKIFKFLTSDTAGSLISTLGFPAVTTQAISMIDELLNRLDDSRPTILFKSRPMRLALTTQAKNDYSGGNERIKIGCLSPGFCILARGRDFNTFLNADATYYPSLDKLVPSDVDLSKLMSGSYDDPFKNMTYAVFRIGMKQAKLDPTFNYG
jgi:hypothetical protein